MNEPIALRRAKLSDMLTADLAGKIREGTFAAGEHLPSERDLMALYGTGRAAVREALHALHKMGFIRIRNGERAVVIAPSLATVLQQMSPAIERLFESEKDIRNLQEARLVFETGLCRRAAMQASEAEIGIIREALEANCAATDEAGFRDTDVDFHLAIASVGGNPNFITVNDLLREWLVEQRRTSSGVPAARERAIESHRAIFDAIAARDRNEAADAMERHLAQVHTMYWEARRIEAALERDKRKALNAQLRAAAQRL
jgi:GntR family transcriptional regulator, sialic acid-inducible nan operon repressor